MVGDSESNTTGLVLIKILCMIVMFILIIVMGSLPLRMRAFKSNKVVLAFAAAFSGGLFLSVGLYHLLPEAVENFEKY